jgi:hypothetical protein
VADLMSRSVRYELPGTAEVGIVHDELADGTRFDLYVPAGDDGPRAAVLFACGFPDPAGRFLNVPPFTSWARLIAASGAVAVLYANRDATSLDAVARQLVLHPAIDPGRLRMFASSGHAPAALAALASRRFERAALLYGYLGGDETAAAATAFRFANPPASELPELPMLVVRCGADEMPGINATIDRFVAGHDVELIDLPGAPHAFELIEDRPEVIARVLAFLTT